MQEISVSRALGASFRLIGREPGSVLAWTVLYVVYTALEWGVAAAVSPGILRLADPASSAQLARDAGRLLMVYPLFLLLGVLAGGVMLGAVYRAILEPEARRFAYLRLGRRELWLMLSLVVWVLLCFAAYLALSIPFAIVQGMVMAAFTSASEGGNVLLAAATVVSLLFSLGVLFLVLWFGVRLSVGLPKGFEQARFVAFAGWDLTRGQGGKMALLSLGLIGGLIVAYLAVLLVAVIFLAVAVGGFSRLTTTGGMPHFSPLLLALAVPVLAIFAMGVFLFLAAPSAEIYRQMKGEDLSVFS